MDPHAEELPPVDGALPARSPLELPVEGPHGGGLRLRHVNVGHLGGLLRAADGAIVHFDCVHVGVGGRCSRVLLQMAILSVQVRILQLLSIF